MCAAVVNSRRVARDHEQEEQCIGTNIRNASTGGENKPKAIGLGRIGVVDST